MAITWKRGGTAGLHPTTDLLELFALTYSWDLQVLVYSGHYASELPPVPGGVNQEVSQAWRR